MMKNTNNKSTKDIELNADNDNITNDTDNNTVFVSGIPYLTSEEELRDLFSPCGDIIEFKLPKYQDSGKNRGFAHITYKDNSSIEKALKLNKHTIGERYLTVDISKGIQPALRKVDIEEIPSDCCTIIVKNLHYEITEKEIASMFKPCGDIKSIRLVYHSVKNHFKGFGFIDFKSHESVNKALRLNGKMLKERPMLVDFEDMKPKNGFKFRSKEQSKYNSEFNNIKYKALNKKRNRDNY